MRPLHFHTGSVCSARLNSVFYTEWVNLNLILNTIGLDLLLEWFILLYLFLFTLYMFIFVYVQYYGDYEEGYDVDFAPRQRNSKKQ